MILGFRRKDGSAVWMHVSPTPILDAERRFTGFFATLTDITQHRLAEAELSKHREHLEFALESAPDLPRYVSVDPGKLGRVLLNLVGESFDLSGSSWRSSLRVQDNCRI